MGGGMAEIRQLLKLNRNSKLPLYELIAQNFRELIATGQLNSGDSIPSEWDLADLYGVSRLTVRRALEDLSRQGWLDRRHGVGTFVTEPTMTQIPASNLSFSDQMLAIGRTPGSRLVAIHLVPAKAEIANSLGIASGEAVVEIIRVRTADGEPILLENAYLSAARFPGLDQAANLAEESLYRYLTRRYHTMVVGIDQTLQPVLLNDEEAQLLNAEAGSPAVLSELVAFDSGGDPVEYCWSVTRGDKCKFYLRFRRGESVDGN